VVLRSDLFLLHPPLSRKAKETGGIFVNGLFNGIKICLLYFLLPTHL
jgi:hypothetical protein